MNVWTPETLHVYGYLTVDVSTLNIETPSAILVEAANLQVLGIFNFVMMNVR